MRLIEVAYERSTLLLNDGEESAAKPSVGFNISANYDFHLISRKGLRIETHCLGITP